MFKKLASIALAATMLVGTAGIAASAAEVKDDSAVAAEDQSVVGAQDSDSVGADAESSSVGAGNVINFDLNSAGWNNYKVICCHIYEIGHDAFYTWQSKKEHMEDEDGDGIWTYDLDKAGVKLESNKCYGVIFSNKPVGMQTADLILTTDCIGDTAYVKDQSAKIENPADSNKTSNVAYWKNNTQCGVVKCVTSIGNVVGDQIPSTTTAYDMFVSFLKNNLTSARTSSGKDDQTLLDDTAKALGIGQDLIPEAIKEAGVDVAWEASKSSAEKSSSSDVKTKSSGGSSNGGSSSSSSSSSSSGSGSSSKSVSSGQETTILFVIGGVMIAAAGVVFLSRKRRMN